MAEPREFKDKAPWLMARLIADFSLSLVQAAAVLGNLGHESNGFRWLQERNPIGGGLGGYGWAQWTGPRRQAFFEWARRNGHSVNSDEGNYGFLRHELNTTHKNSIAALRRTSTLPDAVRAFEQQFERAHPSYKHYERRESWARIALSVFRPDDARVPNRLLTGVTSGALEGGDGALSGAHLQYASLDEGQEDGLGLAASEAEQRSEETEISILPNETFSLWQEERFLDDAGEEIVIRAAAGLRKAHYSFIRDYCEFRLSRLAAEDCPDPTVAA